MASRVKHAWDMVSNWQGRITKRLALQLCRHGLRPLLAILACAQCRSASSPGSHRLRAFHMRMSGRAGRSLLFFSIFVEKQACLLLRLPTIPYLVSAGIFVRPACWRAMASSVRRVSPLAIYASGRVNHWRLRAWRVMALWAFIDSLWMCADLCCQAQVEDDPIYLRLMHNNWNGSIWLHQAGKRPLCPSLKRGSRNGRPFY